jgi:DNA invertase Pin-like site-specific DNA recombinase
MREYRRTTVPLPYTRGFEEGRMHNGIQGRRPIGSRPGPSPISEKLKSSDTLIVWKLDRLGVGLSLRDLITMLEDLRARANKFRSLREHNDTEPR